MHQESRPVPKAPHGPPHVTTPAELAARSAYQRKQWAIGIGVTAAAVLVVILMAVAGSTRHKAGGTSSGSTDGSSAVWAHERSELLSKARGLDVAERAGNLQHAAQIREAIIKQCQNDAGFGGGSGADHQAIVSACAIQGVGVP